MVVVGSAGVIAPGKWRWLRAIGWLASLTIALVALFNLVAKGALLLIAGASGTQIASTSDAPAEYKLVAAIAGSIAILSAYALAVRLGERRVPLELDLRRAPIEVVLGLAVGAAAMSVIVGILRLFDWVVIEPRAIGAIALAMRDSIRSGVVEELLLRLVIFRLLWRAFGIWPALCGASLLFGALHLANPGSSLVAAASLIAGEGIGIGLYLITGRIFAPIGMHAGWNFTQGWIFGASVSGLHEFAGGPLALHPAKGVPDLLSGGAFGPEASLAAMAVSLLASAFLLGLAWRRGDFAPMEPASGAGAPAPAGSLGLA